MCKLVNINTNYNTEVKVADIKRGYVENIISAAEHCSQIIAIILFGSALEERCKETSDIDIAIVSKHTVNALCKMKGFTKFVEQIYEYDYKQKYDRLYFSSLDEIENKQNETWICKELVQKGRIIYRRAQY